MRIEHGKYILTNKDAVRAALTEQSVKIENLQAQLNVAREWALEQLKLHMPSAHCLDLSIAGDGEHLKERFLEELGKNIYCSGCRTPWPCKRIDSLHLLREIVSRGANLEAAYLEVAEMAVDKRPGQIDVHL